MGVCVFTVQRVTLFSSEMWFNGVSYVYTRFTEQKKRNIIEKKLYGFAIACECLWRFFSSHISFCSFYSFNWPENVLVSVFSASYLLLWYLLLFLAHFFFFACSNKIVSRVNFLSLVKLRKKWAVFWLDWLYFRLCAHCQLSPLWQYLSVIFSTAFGWS